MEDSEESLSDIFSGKEPDPVPNDKLPTGDKSAADPAADTATPAAGKADQGADKQAPAADDDKSKAPGDGKATETPPDDKAAPPKEEGGVGAIIAMRKRLQAAEARVRELEGGKGDGKAPSVLDDEDAAFSSRISDGTRNLREQVYHLSVAQARQAHGGTYEEAAQAFAQAAETDDRLLATLRASENPGEYIYSVGIQIKELRDVGGDILKYKDKVTAESRTQLAEKETRIKALEAEVAKLTQEKTDLENLPRSLNGKTSGAAPKVEDEDDEPISKIARFGS